MPEASLEFTRAIDPPPFVNNEHCNGTLDIFLRGGLLLIDLGASARVFQ